MAFRMVIFLLSLMLLSNGAVWSQDAQNLEELTSFFTQGQSIYNANDLAKSRDEALGNLFEQAVTQAIGMIMEPRKIAANYPAIQNSILKRSESYVQNYQVLSESSESGTYKVRAQVSITMDGLRRDLQQLGLDQKQVDLEDDADRDKIIGNLNSENQVLDPDTYKEVSSDSELPPPSPATSLPRFTTKILWAVAEKIGKEWRIARDAESSDAIFALSVFHESQSYDIDLVFDEEQSVQIDSNGSVSLKSAITSAQNADAQAVVIGTAALEKGSRQQTLKVDLRILRSTTLQEQGEIHLERLVGDATPEERALELAALTVPELERILLQASQAKAPSTVSIGDTGSLTLVVSSYRSLSNWEELERILRENIKSLKVKDMELGPEEIRARLEGVTPELPSQLEGIRLRDGRQVHVKGYSQQDRTLNVELAPGGSY